MTTYQASVAFDNSTDASFRAWGSAVSAALAAIGLVKTADTGQINWGTVTHPASSNTYQGYEIWKMNDTNQSSAPVFIKLTYGSGTYQYCPLVATSWGQGSDGAGNLTGSVQSGSYNFLPSAVTANLYACAVDGAFNIVLAGGKSSGPVAFGVWRTCDATGTATSDGWLYYSAFSYPSGSASQFNVGLWNTASSSWTVPQNSTSSMKIFPFPVLSGQVAWTSGSDQSLIVPVVWVGQPFRLKGAVGVGINDFGLGVTFTATVFGSPHTYLHLNTTCVNTVDHSGNTYTTFAYLWE